MKQTNISLTEKQAQKLDDLKKDTGLSKSEIIRRALDDYLRRQSKT